MTKAELRDKYRARRLRMDSRDAEKYSLAICRRLYGEIDWAKVQKICSYEPIAELKEVNVIPLLETVKYKYPNMKIKLIGMSPKSKAPKLKFDLILVPVLAFDADKYRLGWGGGWYDRFLAEQPLALKIGTAYDDSRTTSSLSAEPHDVKLDMVITQRKIYR